MISMREALTGSSDNRQFTHQENDLVRIVGFSV